MPSKKKKYNARFPAGRIKKIMQSDEEIGKVAQAVPVIISIAVPFPFEYPPRTLELFVESLLTKTLKITNSRNAKTLSTSHMKQCIIQEQRFDFLRELVKNIPDINVAEEEAGNYNETDEAANGGQSSPDSQEQDSDTPYDLSMPSTSSSLSALTMRRRCAANQNGDGGGSSHAMHLRGAPAAVAADFSIDVVVDLTEDETRRLNLKRHPPAAVVGSSSSSSSVIMHTKAIGAGNGGGGDCSDYAPPLKLTRSESTPANAHQNIWRSRLKHPQHPQLMIPSHFNNNNHNQNNLLPKSAQQQQRQEPFSLPPPPQTAAAIMSPAQPIFSYDFCNKPLVKLDYSNLPMSAGIVNAAPVSAAAVIAPLSAPTHGSCGDTSAFNFSIAAPVINIDLSNIAVVPPPPPTSASLSLPAAALAYRPPPPQTPAAVANTFCRGVAVGPSSLAASNLLDPKAPSYSVSSSLTAPSFKPNNYNHNIGSSAAATNSNFYELDEDYDNI